MELTEEQIKAIEELFGWKYKPYTTSSHYAAKGVPWTKDVFYSDKGEAFSINKDGTYSIRKRIEPSKFLRFADILEGK